MSKKIVTVCFEVEETDGLLAATIHGFISTLETIANSRIISVSVKEEKTVYVSSTLVKVDGEWRKERKNREFIEAIPKL